MAEVNEITMPDLRKEADRSHFWTLVLKQYKRNNNSPETVKALINIMLDATSMADFNNLLGSSSEILGDKAALSKEIEGYFRQSAEDWAAGKTPYGRAT